MNATVSLIDPSSNNTDEVFIEEIKNKNDFSYLDNQEAECHVLIQDKTLHFQRKAKDHTLEIHANKDKIDVFVQSIEGRFKIDAKVVDFIFDNDILEMRYLIDSDLRIFKIQYQ